MEQTKASKDFEAFLKSIGGLENGFTAIPNKWAYPVGYRMYLFFRFIGFGERSNPFRSKIYSRGFFSITDGWLPLVEQLIQDLVKAGWNKELCQCKEKFGGLRFYINGGSEQIWQIISKAESDSYKICETCGSTEGVSQTRGGWITTLCAVHLAEAEKTKKN